MVILPGYAAYGQNRVSGKVVDFDTREPVPYANVFFANTTFGSSTSTEGEYSIADFPDGKYDLTVSSVGYELYVVSIEFKNGDERVQQISLKQQTTLLNEVVVKPDTINRQRNLEIFKRLFLGTSKYAGKAVIENLNTIDIFYDINERLMVAHATTPIIINLHATGYKIYYHLNQFEYNLKTGALHLFGTPQFEEMNGSPGQKKRWERNRKDIYEGSITHFMRSWLNQSLKSDGFTMSRIYIIPNKERPPDEVIERKIVLHMNADSMGYYLRLRNLPRQLDSTASEQLSGAEFISKDRPGFENFTGLLKVSYRAREDHDYAALMGHPSIIQRQQSIIRILEPISIYANGYYEDARNIVVQYYWSWSEKVATLLPLDYDP